MPLPTTVGPSVTFILLTSPLEGGGSPRRASTPYPRQYIPPSSLASAFPVPPGTQEEGTKDIGSYAGFHMWRKCRPAHPHHHHHLKEESAPSSNPGPLASAGSPATEAEEVTCL